MEPRHGRLMMLMVAAALLLSGGFAAGMGVRAAPAEPHDVRPRAREVPPAPVPISISSSAVRADAGGVQMALRIDRTAVLEGSDGQLYAELELAADAQGGDEPRAPTDFVVLLDRSGSMAGEKLAFAKAAAQRLLDRLADDDRFALVTYDDEAELALPLSFAPARERARFRHLIERVQSGDSTNLSGGLDRAVDALEAKADARRQRRVLLLSDGLANHGDTSRTGLEARARRITKQGAVLTTMGIGDDFDQPLMTALSESGEGNFYYLARLDALAGFFEAELLAATRTVARNVTVHFVPGAFVQLHEASGYAIERHTGESRFSPGSLYAGQKRSIWLTLSVPTARASDFQLGQVRVTYEQEGTLRELAANIEPRVACVRDRSVFERGIVRDVWERAVSTEEYGKYTRKLADLVARGTPEEVEKATHEYARKNEQLAVSIGAKRVSASVLEAKQKAAEAKVQQAEPPPVRAISGKRLEAGAKFQRNRDAYLSDPARGLF